MIFGQIGSYVKRCVLISLVGALACNNEKEPDTRSFYMGFTPFPYASSSQAANYVYDKLATESDIINHHFDNGVPWQEASDGSPFDQVIQDDWTFRRNKTGSSHKIYVSVTPLNFSRTGLAFYRAQTDNMPLPFPWNEYKFDHPDVKTAYLNYCKRIIDFFKPDYFNMAIEANLLYVNQPGLWSGYMELHTFVYRELKAAYPKLPIFSSVSGTHLLKGYVDGNDAFQQRLAVLQLLEYSDYYALSFYPYLNTSQTNPYSKETFDELFHISEKPLAIAETAYMAEKFSFRVGANAVTIESDQLKQQKYFHDLLSACERRKAEFVIDFVIRDCDELWAQADSPTGINIARKDAGLYDEKGNPRIALISWKEYLSKKYQH